MEGGERRTTNYTWYPTGVEILVIMSHQKLSGRLSPGHTNLEQTIKNAISCVLILGYSCAKPLFLNSLCRWKKKSAAEM